jgi:transposase
LKRSERDPLPLIVAPTSHWFAVEPVDMRAAVDTAVARVVSVFGEARAHHAYLFDNKRANQMKVLVHDGLGFWLCARRLYEGSFIRAVLRKDRSIELTHDQLQAIVVGLPREQARILASEPRLPTRRVR